MYSNFSTISAKENKYCGYQHAPFIGSPFVDFLPISDFWRIFISPRPINILWSLHKTSPRAAGKG